MHFSTFMKLLTQTTGERIRDIEKYAKPGGFDYWRSSRDGLVQHSAHGRDRSRVVADIEANPAENTVENNKVVFESCADWLAKQSQQRFAPNRGVWPSPNGVFSVHIEPEIGIEKRNGEKQVIAVYPRKEPRLTRDIGGAGVLLLRRGYRGDGTEVFGVLDAGAGAVVKAQTNVSEMILDEEIDRIEQNLRRVLAA